MQTIAESVKESHYIQLQAPIIQQQCSEFSSDRINTA